MLNIQWQEQELPIRRLIVRLGHERSFDHFVEQLAEQHHLALAEETVAPLPGDFWLGTHPRTGWADADPGSIAWSSIVELPLALSALRRASARNVPSRIESGAAFIVQAA